MATMRDVAELAGVSLTTVSHVINETRYVSDPVTERVLNAMNQLGYRPNDLARSLRRGHTNTIGLILPDSANPYFAEIAHAIEATFFELGYSVILGNSQSNIAKEEHYVDVLLKKQVDGMIFVATGDQADIVHKLLKKNFPIVLVDRDLVGLAADVVILDNHLGGWLVGRHLTALGHQRIGCISGPSILRPSSERVNGYRQALSEAGLAYDPALVLQGDFHPHSGYQAALKLLSQPNPPTAIFTCNDLMAMGAIRAAAEAGREVPDDLAIVGFDDIELASYTKPPLTTVSQPIEEMGRIAAQLLKQRIEDGEAGPRRELLSPQLVIRGSCGAHL